MAVITFPQLRPAFPYGPPVSDWQANVAAFQSVLEPIIRSREQRLLSAQPKRPKLWGQVGIPGLASMSWGTPGGYTAAPTVVGRAAASPLALAGIFTRLRELDRRQKDAEVAAFLAGAKDRKDLRKRIEQVQSKRPSSSWLDKLLYGLGLGTKSVGQTPTEAFTIESLIRDTTRGGPRTRQIARSNVLSEIAQRELENQTAITKALAYQKAQAALAGERQATAALRKAEAAQAKAKTELVRRRTKHDYGLIGQLASRASNFLDLAQKAADLAATMMEQGRKNEIQPYLVEQQKAKAEHQRIVNELAKQAKPIAKPTAAAKPGQIDVKTLTSTLNNLLRLHKQYTESALVSADDEIRKEAERNLKVINPIIRNVTARLAEATKVRLKPDKQGRYYPKTMDQVRQLMADGIDPNRIMLSPKLQREYERQSGAR